LSHLGEIVVFPDFANALAKQIRDLSGGKVVCAVYTRHENANRIDPELVLVNFTLDESSFSRASWAPPGSKLVLSAWGGRTRDDVDVNYLEHHYMEHTLPSGSGRVCPATRPDTEDKTCDGVKCAFCFKPARHQRRPTDNPPAKPRKVSSGWLATLEKADQLLDARYSTPDLGNLPDPTDELFYILLSNKSDPSRYGDIFRKLREHLGSWDRLRHVDGGELALLLAPLGLADQRSARFVEIANTLYQVLGSVSLEPLREWSVPDALTFLATLPGAGEKSARCVLMYSLGADVFPIDSHVMRVSVRLGLVPSKWSLAKAQQRFDAWLPPGTSHRLHVNMVAHGRSLCRPTNPKCSDCPLTSFCPKKGVPKPRRREK
jgi:endonuclease III